MAYALQLFILCSVFGFVYSYVICDYSTNTFALETDLVRISFYERPPSFQVKYLNTTTPDGQNWELTFTVSHLQELASNGTVNRDYDISNLPEEDFVVDCISSNGTSSLKFTVLLPNNATAEIEGLITPPDAIMMESTEYYAPLLTNSLLFTFKLHNWTWIGNTSDLRLVILTDMETTASLLTISLPTYYPDGNIQSVRMGGAKSDVEAHIPDQAWICDNFETMDVATCDASDTDFTMTQSSMSPLKASFSTVVSKYFAENQTLVYQAAVEFPPLTITKGTIIGLAIGLSVGAVAFIGLAVAGVYFYRKTKREERIRYQNWKLGKEDNETDATPLINND